MSGFHSVLSIAIEVEGPEYGDLYGNGWEHSSPERTVGFGFGLTGSL